MGAVFAEAGVADRYMRLPIGSGCCVTLVNTNDCYVSAGAAM